MNKILYSPKEGTTGFWGLRGCPEYTDFEECKLGRYTEYDKALESCKEKKLEIVNPEVLESWSIGEPFDLPIGYEFKEEDIPLGDVKEIITVFRKVLRLVKTETKVADSQPKLWADPQPEPEESQTLTEDEYFKLLGVDRTHAIAMTIWDTLKHHNFTIQRKKQ